MSRMLVSEKDSAKDKVFESIRKLLTLKMTLPLGNPNLKLVHTNQFLYTELPSEFGLANMKRIDNAITSAYSRNSGYDLNRWYIESVTINNNGKSATMELELNPYATPLTKFKEGRLSYMDAYEQAFKKDEKNDKVASVKTDNSSVKGGEGKIIDSKVEEIVGDETDNLKKAKLIHEWLLKNRHYKGYMNSRTSSPTQAYNRRMNPGINCADTSRLTASMFRSAGIPCFVVHSTCHYYTVMTYNGKEYCSDATSNSRRFNTYWKASGCKGSTATFKGKSSYYAKCGDKPCS